MTSIESPNESLNSNYSLMDLEIESARLDSKAKLSALKIETLKGKFRLVRNSNDYKIYSYTLEKGGVPAAIRAKAVKENLTSSQEKNKILITNAEGKKYDESHKFSGGEKIYVKIPIKKSGAETKKVENQQKKAETKKEQTEAQQPKIGVFEYKNSSVDGQFEIYSYTVGDTAKSYWNILNEAGKQIKLKTTSGIEVTDENGNKILGPFKNEKIYIRVPKYNVESDVKIIEGMKCKGGEYFGIDLSRYNIGNANKGKDDKEYAQNVKNWWAKNKQDRLEAFKKEANRANWDSKDSEKRGVSFCYIRVGDGAAKYPETDEVMLENWMNFIQDYNNDKTVKNNNEQIATGLYWTISLNPETTGESEAQNFLEKYNKYNNKKGMNQLVPMLDIEDTMFRTYDRKTKKRKEDPEKTEKTKKRALQWLEYVESKTGIIPGLYIGAASYGNHIINDARFSKYKTVWVAAYSSSRIDSGEGTVRVGGGDNGPTIKPAMYQASKNETVAGTGNSKGHTDANHAKDVRKLFSKNNKSK